MMDLGRRLWRPVRPAADHGRWGGDSRAASWRHPSAMQSRLCADLRPEAAPLRHAELGSARASSVHHRLGPALDTTGRWNVR